MPQKYLIVVTSKAHYEFEATGIQDALRKAQAQIEEDFNIGMTETVSIVATKKEEQ